MSGYVFAETDKLEQIGDALRTTSGSTQTYNVSQLSETAAAVISSGNVVTYPLPIANATELGGVMPVAKTAAMTEPVGVDANGLLYTSIPEIDTSILVKKSGDTINGTMYYQGNPYSIAFAIGTSSVPESVSLLLDSDGSTYNHLAIRQYGVNGKRENFNLPRTLSPSANINYNIHTTKTLKYAQGTSTVSGSSETTIDYSSAGFTSVPQVFINYSSTEASWTGDNGAIKVYSKTTTNAKAIVGGNFNTARAVDWFAIGT